MILSLIARKFLLQEQINDWAASQNLPSVFGGRYLLNSQYRVHKMGFDFSRMKTTFYVTHLPTKTQRQFAI
jgi:hypothetical protein